VTGKYRGKINPLWSQRRKNAEGGRYPAAERRVIFESPIKSLTS
jgi:hypothetical protein